jgi:hypothetical protein
MAAVMFGTQAAKLSDIKESNEGVKMSSNLLRDFALDAAGVSVLITMQQGLILEDTLFESNHEKKLLKQQWRNEWETIVNKGFEPLKSDEGTSDIPAFLPPDSLRKMRSTLTSDRSKSGLVLLELVSFAPYFPFDPSQVKRFKSLSMNSDIRKKRLRTLALDLGFPVTKPADLEGAIKSTMNSMTGKWWKLGVGILVGLGLGAFTLGLAAPFIGGLIGTSLLGLHGAAATVAGLAAIGGGSVAAGGLGMAGGTAILVGGGALLGLGTGAGGGYWVATMTSGTALFQAAKLEVTLKEFILQGQYDTAKAQEILIRQRSVIQEMEKEIDRLRMNGNEDNKRIKDLEGAVNILNRALKRNQDFFKVMA